MDDTNMKTVNKDIIADDNNDTDEYVCGLDIHDITGQQPITYDRRKNPTRFCARSPQRTRRAQKSWII